MPKLENETNISNMHKVVSEKSEEKSLAVSMCRMLKKERFGFLWLRRRYEIEVQDLDGNVHIVLDSREEDFDSIGRVQLSHYLS